MTNQKVYECYTKLDILCIFKEIYGKIDYDVIVACNDGYINSILIVLVSYKMNTNIEDAISYMTYIEKRQEFERLVIQRIKKNKKLFKIK